MKPADSDEMYFGLLDELLKLNLLKMGDIALRSIIDKHSVKYLLTKAKIKIDQKQYSEATTALDELLSKQKDNV